MTTETTTSSLALINAQFEMHTMLFKNVTLNIKNEDREKKMNNNTNHIAWIVGHMVSTRYMIANVLGAEDREPFPEFFGQGQGIQNNVTYPSLPDLIKDWDAISAIMFKKINSITDAYLETESPFPTPMGSTMKDFFAFITHHEAYTIGQLGIYRRFLGYDAMKYN